MTGLTMHWLTAAISSGTRVWTVPPATGFVDAIATGVLAETGDDPLALAEITVLVPTRRAARTLREAFLRLTDGKPLLLPRMMALQDIDEDEALLSGFAADTAVPPDIPPAMAPLRRHLLLARQIMKLPGPDGRHPGADQAVRLAQELARLLDQVQRERLSFDTLTDLVPDDLASHWQVTLEFLKIVTAHWPMILEAEDVVDPADHLNHVFKAQAEAWQSAPPKGLVIAAGSTGSVPATRDLLAVVRHLPKGCVVLPGLDQDLDETGWQAVDESHPQFMLKTLLGHLEMNRPDVTVWPAGQSYGTGAQRQRLLSDVMRPAATSEQWRTLSHLTADALIGLQRLEAPTPREEAAAIALILRGVAEEPEKTGALVTPDRDLARRVGAELERWDLSVNDSAGRPLAHTPPGVFLLLTAAMVLDDCAPVPLLAALKHPLAAGGRAPAEFRTRVRDLERTVLRGPRPAAGFDGLRATLAAAGHADRTLEDWLAEVADLAAPFADLISGGPQPLGDLLDAHLEFAEALAATDESAGPLRLWRGDDGEAVARFAADLKTTAGVLEKIPPSAYPGLLDALMDGQVARPTYGTHARLSILGPLEARLLHPDLVILAGLNEGTWPAEPAADPWMSRPMRKAFGLPAPERRIGQAAHDVAQAMAAPEVVLSRSVKVEGTPTVPSRWWRRLDQVIKAADLPRPIDTGRYSWLPWATALTKPDRIAPWPAPEPKPPVSARPRRMSVTEIETWMRDPYEIYARHVLKLRALDPLDADANLAAYGTIVHEILQRFVEAHPVALPPDPAAALTNIADTLFGQADVAPSVQAFWQPRFERIAEWFLDQEAERRAAAKHVHAEVRGELALDGPAGPFTLRAVADRIEARADGTLAIIDYKTGSVPRKAEVEAGFAPQLPLEAVIAAAGGFEGIAAKTVSELQFWKLSGRDAGGTVQDAGDDPDALRDDALKGLTDLITTFDDPETSYKARPHPDHAPAYGETQHLARVKEWAAAEGGEG